MKLTLIQAAALVGKSKSSVFRAVKSGAIPTTRGEDGAYLVDDADVIRAFQPTPQAASVGAARGDSDALRLELLIQENQFMKRQLETEREFRAELSKRLDEADSERRQLMLRLMDQGREQVVIEAQSDRDQGNGDKGRLWWKLFGRKR